jgi:hypothetical protein
MGSHFLKMHTFVIHGKVKSATKLLGKKRLGERKDEHKTCRVES